MQDRLPLRRIVQWMVLAGTAFAGHALQGCASDSSSANGDDFLDAAGVSPESGAGGFFGAGGTVGAGGFFGAGGTSQGTGGVLATGGASFVAGEAGTDAAVEGSADAGCVVPSAPVVETSSLPWCNVPGLDQCTDGKCVPTSLVPEASRSLLADCDATNKCVPEHFVQYFNQFIQPTCRSVNDAEGRCLSLCIPQVSDQASLLPRDICKTSELCAPCFDPRTGVDTGACHQGCDTGPTEPPRLFDECCGGQGLCVPASLVPASDLSQLGTDTCTTAGQVCAPDKLTDLTYVPKACFSLLGLEGRCLPGCLPAVAAQKDRLPQDVCDAGELCAPCYDPVTGTDTGACTRNGDSPKNPPVVFDACCGGLGHCVPASLLSTEQQALLAGDTCTSSTDLCAPDVFAGTGLKPETCRALGSLDAEGRCIPDCVPSVADQADRLSQSTCDAGYLCAPCYDPITGADTGACTQNGDAPVEAKKTFADCCGGRGSCIPKSIVPDAQESQLGKDTCQGTDDLCVPDKLADPSYVPPSCTSLGGAEGRCLADCLPAVSAQKDRLPQDSCSLGELCAPCYDPITGASTGACTQNGDQPVDPPYTFPVCCGTLGHCVPSSILTTSQQSQLGKDTCTGSGELCAPDVFATAGVTPEPCRALGTFDAEGRCIPSCVPAIGAQADRLSQATCDAGYLCAPCYDPITGADTGACTQNGDAPKEAKKTFADCCGGQGSCIPKSIVPDAQESQLGKDTCTGSTDLCVPDKLSVPGYVPKTCSSIGGGEGRCLASCLPAILAQGGRLPQDICDATERCAPCYDPLTGADTGACTLNGDTPKEPPYVFDVCCSGMGHCVPSNILTSSQQSQLGVDTCTTAGDLCAPDVFAVAGQTAPTCRALDSFDAEGRCIPTCVPAIAAQASRLTQSTCAANTLCAPCYDPFTGVDTNACTQNGDAPVEAKKTFPLCCGGLGTCVPSTLVPADQKSQLGRDTCTDSQSLCAPTKLTDPAVKPAQCTAPGNVEGRCLPGCLPDIQAQASNLRQGTCATGELCAPCYNPLDGTDTGACHLNGDAPKNPPVVYAGCCAYNGTDRGTCIPPELLSSSQASSLPQDSCSTGFLCAPDLKVADPTAKFPSCTNVSFACLFGCPGACVPDCIVDPTQRPLIAQTGTNPCAAGELCAPCVIPLTGQNTHACE